MTTSRLRLISGCFVSVAARAFVKSSHSSGNFQTRASLILQPITIPNLFPSMNATFCVKISLLKLPVGSHSFKVKETRGCFDNL